VDPLQPPLLETVLPPRLLPLDLPGQSPLRLQILLGLQRLEGLPPERLLLRLLVKVRQSRSLGFTLRLQKLVTALLRDVLPRSELLHLIIHLLLYAITQAMKPLLVVLYAPHLLSLPACQLDLHEQASLLDLQELDARPQLHLLSLHRRTRRLQLKQRGLLRHGREWVRRHRKGG